MTSRFQLHECWELRRAWNIGGSGDVRGGVAATTGSSGGSGGGGGGCMVGKVRNEMKGERGELERGKEKGRSSLWRSRAVVSLLNVSSCYDHLRRRRTTKSYSSLTPTTTDSRAHSIQHRRLVNGFPLDSQLKRLLLKVSPTVHSA
ncbi:hypothetical protein M0802_005875 [Mischocyttarus mexicanus]|nr:hypothetical protein M0802_005875 [Mischocyttarus mexicanus]